MIGGGVGEAVGSVKDVIQNKVVKGGLFNKGPFIKT